jgi:hypothetical protein
MGFPFKKLKKKILPTSTMWREGSARKIGAARPNPIPSHTCKYHKQGKSYRLKLYLQVTPGAEDCTQCQSPSPSVRAAVCTQGQTCGHRRIRTALFVHVVHALSYSYNPTDTTYVSPSRGRRKSHHIRPTKLIHRSSTPTQRIHRHVLHRLRPRKLVET